MRHRGGIDLPMIGVSFSGPIVVSRRMLEKTVDGERSAGGRYTFNERFRRPEDRLEEAESATPPIPAWIEHRSWRPPQHRGTDSRRPPAGSASSLLDSQNWTGPRWLFPSYEWITSPASMSTPTPAR